MKALKRIVIWSITIFIVCGISYQTYMAFNHSSRKPVLKYTAQQGPLDIKLVALNPVQGKDFYDVYGNKIDPIPLPDMPRHAIPYNIFYYISFIFEIPRDEEFFLPDQLMQIMTSSNHYLAISQQYSIFEHNGRKFIAIDGLFQNYYGHSSFLGIGKDRYSYINLSLSYYSENSGKNQPVSVMFKGPFSPGAPTTQLNNYASTIVFNEDIIDDAGVPTANFTITGRDPGWLCAYDKAGNPHMVTAKTIEGTPWRGGYICYIKGIKLSEIDLIKYGQGADTQKFENIKIPDQIK